MKVKQYNPDQSSPPTLRGYLTVTLVLLAQLIFSNLSIAASRVIYENFNDGTFGAFSIQGQSNPEVLTTAYDGGGPHSGSYFCSVNISSVFDGVHIPSWSFNNEHLIRLWMRFDADVNYTGGYKMLRHGYHGVAGDDKMTFGFQNKEYADPTLYVGTSIHGTRPANMFWDNAWHKIEIYVKAAVNGAYKIWVDDSIILNYSGNTISGDGDWDSLHIPSNFVGSISGGNHMYIDSVEIYSDIGTGAIGSLSDGTSSVSGVSGQAPPNPPIPQ